MNDGFYKQAQHLAESEEKDKGKWDLHSIVGVCIHEDGMVETIPVGACRFSNWFPAIESQTMGNAVWFASVQATRMMWLAAQLNAPIENGGAEPPPRPTQKPPAVTHKTALVDRKKEYREILRRRTK